MTIKKNRIFNPNKGCKLKKVTILSEFRSLLANFDGKIAACLHL